MSVIIIIVYIFSKKKTFSLRSDSQKGESCRRNERGERNKEPRSPRAGAGFSEKNVFRIAILERQETIYSA